MRCSRGTALCGCPPCRCDLLLLAPTIRLLRLLLLLRLRRLRLLLLGLLGLSLLLWLSWLPQLLEALLLRRSLLLRLLGHLRQPLPPMLLRLLRLPARLRLPRLPLLPTALLGLFLLLVVVHARLLLVQLRQQLFHPLLGVRELSPGRGKCRTRAKGGKPRLRVEKALRVHPQRQ